MPNAPRILVVDDDPDITNLLEIYLQGEGYEADVAASKAEMEKCLEQSRYDLILLDIRLPDGDGFDITRELHKESDAAIIIISRKTSDVDQIVGLELGADDYVSKPFEPRTLLARIKSVLRRYNMSRPMPQDNGTEVNPIAVDGPMNLEIGDWKLDRATYRLTHRDGRQHVLSSNEAGLLAFFVQNEGKVLTRNDLMLAVTGREWEYMDRSIDIMIVRLRKKIEPEPAHPRFIQTVRGSGYIFQNVSSDT